MGDDFNYGYFAPRETPGWASFQEEQKRMYDWIKHAVIHEHDAVFFRVPWNMQLNLQNTNPSLMEAWNHYLTLLAVLEENPNDNKSR